MKKKIIAIAVVVAMFAIGAIGSTLAYFVDDEYNANVMTVGNVDIRQDEIFDEDTVLQPGDEVTKQVTVTNKGQGDAYIRTLIAFEDTWDIGSNVQWFANCYCADETTCKAINQPDNGTDDWLQFKVTAPDGTWTVYTVGIYDYDYAGTLTNSILPAGESVTSLTAIKLKEGTENDFHDKAGDTYEVLVLTQAVQTHNFATAEEAFEAEFDIGTITYEDDDVVASWFAEQFPADYVVEGFDWTSYNWDEEPTWTDEEGTVTAPAGE